MSIYELIERPGDKLSNLFQFMPGQTVKYNPSMLHGTGFPLSKSPPAEGTNLLIVDLELIEGGHPVYVTQPVTGGIFKVREEDVEEMISEEN